MVKKYLTRDAPLIAIEFWYEARVKNFGDFFGFPFPASLFLSRNGAFEFYTDLKAFDAKLPLKLARWLRIKENQKKIRLVRRYMREGLNYFNNIRASKNITALDLLRFISRTKKYMARGLLGVIISHHVPRWQEEFKSNHQILFNDGLVKEIMEWREIVYNRSQLPLIKKGEILIAPMTSPWYLPAMKKASAIITDEGGISCHAAIVARELNKPCIIGTRIATQLFKDGDFVEVDANAGIVRRLL